MNVMNYNQTTVIDHTHILIHGEYTENLKILGMIND